MDPNKLLHELIRLCDAVYHDNSTQPGAREEDINQLCDFVEQLDDWLSNGGFLPQAWNTP